jgi:uncharacterized protein (TIGR02145 family)
MKTKIKAAFAALALLVVISCKKETSSIQSSTIGDENSTQHDFNASYASVTIGTQVWMRKNLHVSRYRNGDWIPQVKDSAMWATLTTGAWCWYNNDSATGAVYGRLYNWYAINDPRGLAPAGWHIPSDSEWLATSTFLDTDARNAGGKMKETGTTHWLDPNVGATNSRRFTALPGEPYVGGKMKETGTTHWFDPNIDATNSSGFTALPGGYRSATGQFCYITYLGLWWTSTEYNTSVAWYRRILCYSGTLDRWRFPKQMGFSVRCIKD